MVGFHFCYDLTELAGVSLPWFKPPFEDVWRASISWTFLFIAGLMCSFSRSNGRRACRYGALALLIWVATTVAAVDVPINFGIIFCMAASTGFYWLLDRIGVRPRGLLCAAALLILFVALLGLPHGYVGIGPFRAAVPASLYSTELFSWAGLPGPGFASGDYYPALPYSLMFLCGASVGPLLQEAQLPKWAYGCKVPVLDFLGRHPLEVYVLHQPVLLGLSALIGGI